MKFTKHVATDRTNNNSCNHNMKNRKKKGSEFLDRARS